MALQQTLTKPFVVEPLKGHPHTHTVIFLHRHPAATEPESLRTKVLSAKRTQDGQTLRLQFPSVRWVFPHAKLHLDAEGEGGGHPIMNGPNPKHWANLTPEDCAAAGLELGPSAPYVAQLVLQEAQRAGGLDRVVLGGQGETALAAHDALDRLRKTMGAYAPETAMHAFVEEQMRLHAEDEDEDKDNGEPQPWKLAGYVGMHPDNDQVPRDQRDFSLVCNLGGSNPYSAKNGNSFSNDLIRNTPHEFIRGGYTDTSAMWGGPPGARTKTPSSSSSSFSPASPPSPSSKPVVSGPIEGHSDDKAGADKQKALDDRKRVQQKHAEEYRLNKQREAEHRQKILRQIENQKAERRLRDKRERERRFHAEQAELERKAFARSQPPTYAAVASKAGRGKKPVDSRVYVNPYRVGIDNKVHDPSKDPDESDQDA
ncbi:uncharacterized protein PG986_012757 [Apiospora aurea]|uniref:Uncharacterized protein n=1 Tax=Apiospora aurea TaxID=335848 RepID=A0ABR1Q1C8_9PEZI